MTVTARTRHSTPGTRPQDGIRITNTPLILGRDGKIYLRPGKKPPIEPFGPAKSSVAIRCVGCVHLYGMDLVNRGKLCTCNLGHWKQKDGKKLWLTPSRLFSPPGAVAKIAGECTDREDTEMRVP